LNANTKDLDKYKDWKVIAEEDESSQRFEEGLKAVLSLKAGEVVFNDDEEA